MASKEQPLNKGTARHRIAPPKEQPSKMGSQQALGPLVRRAKRRSRSLSEQELVQLQRAVGNQAVGQLLYRSKQQPSAQDHVQRMIVVSPEDFIKKSNEKANWNEKIRLLKEYISGPGTGVGAVTGSFLGDIKDSIRNLRKTQEPKTKEIEAEMMTLWEKIGTLLIFENPSETEFGKEFNFSEPKRRYEEALLLIKRLISYHHMVENIYWGDSSWDDQMKRREEAAASQLKVAKERELGVASTKEAGSNERRRVLREKKEAAPSPQPISVVERAKSLADKISQMKQDIARTKTMIEHQLNDITLSLKIASQGIPKKTPNISKAKEFLEKVYGDIGKYQAQLQSTSETLAEIKKKAPVPSLMDANALAKCEDIVAELYRSIEKIQDIKQDEIKSDIRNDTQDVVIGQSIKGLFIPSFGSAGDKRKKEIQTLVVKLAESKRVLDPEHLIGPDDLEKAEQDIYFYTSRKQELEFLLNSDAPGIQIGKLNWKDLCVSLRKVKLDVQAGTIEKQTPTIAEQFQVRLNQMLYGADGVLWYPDRVLVVQHKSISKQGNPLEEALHARSSTKVDAPYKEELRKATNQLAGFTAAGGLTAQGGLPEVPPPGLNKAQLVTILLPNWDYADTDLKAYSAATSQILREKTGNGLGAEGWRFVNRVIVTFKNRSITLDVTDGATVQPRL